MSLAGSRKDDILVAPLTNPAWTPLFAIASAVITEVGGILSHGAIVARGVWHTSSNVRHRRHELACEMGTGSRSMGTGGSSA